MGWWEPEQGVCVFVFACVCVHVCWGMQAAVGYLPSPLLSSPDPHQGVGGGEDYHWLIPKENATVTMKMVVVKR